MEKVVGKIGEFGYVSKVEGKIRTRYVFPNEGFYEFLESQSDEADSFISYGTSTVPLTRHLADCTLISLRNLLRPNCEPGSSLVVINPDKSKRDVAISKLVEFLS